MEHAHDVGLDILISGVDSNFDAAGLSSFGVAGLMGNSISDCFSCHKIHGFLDYRASVGKIINPESI
jgi:hypothetical protein